MRTLLIVDDNVELASLLAVVAEVHGFAPRVAHSGLQALEQMDKEAPEAALVDLHLPDIAGQDLLKALNARGVVTFAMSGVFKGEQFARAAVETYGAKAYFEKPFAARDAMVKMVGFVNAALDGPPPRDSRPSSPPRPRFAATLPTVDALIARAQAEIAAQAVARANPPGPASPAPSASSEGEVPSVEDLIDQKASAPAAAPADDDESLDLGEDDEAKPAKPASVPSLDAMEQAETTGIFASGPGGGAKPGETEITVEPIRGDPGEGATPPAPERDEPESAEEQAAAPAPASAPPPPPADADEEPESPPAEAESEVPAPAALPEQEAAAPEPQPQPEAERRQQTWAPPPESLRRPEVSQDTPLPLHPGTLAALLARFAARRATGELRIKRGEVLKVIGLKDGEIVFAASNLSNERLPRWALRTGKLPANRVQELQSQLKKGARTCDVLVGMGLVTQDERIKLVAGLVREIVWTLLDAEGGEAVFVTRAPPRKGLLPLALDPIAVVLRGYRQVFSLVRLRELVDPDKRFVHSQDTTWTPEELGLGTQESTLFAAADGSKTLDDLLLLSELEEREALVALVALTHLGLLEARPPPRRRIVLG
ncbi:MAG TPA: response regulator [Myxococcales bacterium]